MFKFLLIFYLSFLLTFEAHAYIDPGSGSIIIQAIIGAIATAGTTLTIYWRKIKDFFKKEKKKMIVTNDILEDMLSTKEDIYPDYSEVNFEKEL